MSKPKIETHKFGDAESFLMSSALHFRLLDTKNEPKDKQDFPSYDDTKRVFNKIRDQKTSFSHEEIRTQLICVIHLSNNDMFANPLKIQNDPDTSKSDKVYFANVYKKYHVPLKKLCDTLLITFVDTLAPHQKATAVSLIDHNHGELSARVLYDILHI